NGERAEGQTSVIGWVFSDLGRRYQTTLSNSALTALADPASDADDATVILERETLNRLGLGQTTLTEAGEQGLGGIRGEAGQVADLFGLLDDFSPMFEIVEPKPGS